MKQWMQNAVDVCAMNGDQITADEIAELAAKLGVINLPSTFISRLRASRAVTVEVIGVQPGKGASFKKKIYRVTARKS